MNKTEIVNDLAERLSLPKTECYRFLQAWQTLMTERLSKSDSLILQGFGTFHPWSQTAREGRNPRTGETCLIRPRRSVKFKPGKMLLQKLNNTEK